MAFGDFIGQFFYVVENERMGLSTSEQAKDQRLAVG
jgi:hypothetical protein